MKATKFISILLVMLTLCFVTSCAKNGDSGNIDSILAPSVESIILSQTEAILKEGETVTLICTILPEKASANSVEWVSSNPAVATVDNSGMVTAVSAGSCTIVASADGKNAMANITVKIKGPDFNAVAKKYANSYWLTVGSDGSYLNLDTNPYDIDDFTASGSLAAIKEINQALGLPESLYSDMLNTNSLMGKQNESFPSLGISVSWSYHPDNGMEINYKLISE